MNIYRELTIKNLTETEMVDEIARIMRITNLQFYRIETFMSPNFLRITIYELDYEEAEKQNHD